MKNVLLRAPVLSLSGYGVHSRQVYEWLESRSDINLTVEVVKWGQTAWMINPEYENGIIKRIMDKSGDVKNKTFDYSFQVQLPDEWDPKLAKKNIGISAFVETDRCNPAWIDKCNQMDAVIVPSNFTKNVAKRSGVLEIPIFVIPEWYNKEIDKDHDSLKIELDETFNFLMIGTVTSTSADDDRKNLFYGLKWFCERFRDRKDVGLIMKCSFGKGTKIDRKLTTNIIKSAISDVRTGDYPKITLIHGNMSDKEIAQLYRHDSIKCLVAPTKGEGYGLPIIEAAASGVPVIATGWSGHTDFLEKGKYLDVDYTLKEVSEKRIDSRIFMKGSKWADVSEKSFKRKLKSLKDNYDLHKKNAIHLQSKVKTKFCKRSVMSEYNNFLNNLL